MILKYIFEREIFVQILRYVKLLAPTMCYIQDIWLQKSQNPFFHDGFPLKICL